MDVAVDPARREPKQSCNTRPWRSDMGVLGTKTSQEDSMSRCSFAASAVALATLATLTQACQSGISVGGVAGAIGGGGSFDWCDGRDSGDQHNLETDIQNAQDFDHDSIKTLAVVGCSANMSDSTQEAAAAYHDKLVKWSKLPAAEVDAYLSARVEDPDPIKKTCEALSLDQQAQRGLGKLLECHRFAENGSQIDKDPYALEDEASSALASLAAVRQCVGGSGPLSGVKPAENEVSFALCGSEWRALQRNKASIDRELTQLEVTPAARTMVRLSLRQVEGTMAATEAQLAPKLKDDLALRSFYYDVPDKGYRGALRVAREGAADLAAVRAFEKRFARSSRPQVAGCYLDLRLRLVALFQRKKATTFDKLRHEMVGPVGYQISRALEACARKDGQEDMGLAVAQWINQADAYRGPRTMVYWFLRDALAKMDGDKPTTVEELDRLRVPTPDPLGRIEPPGTTEEGVEALITKVSRAEGGVVVEFKPIIEKVEVADCKETDKIDSINEHGKVVYKEKCGPSWTETERTDIEPAFVRSENAGGLAPGRKVKGYCTGSQKPRVCAPFLVSDAKGDAVFGFLGVDVGAQGAARRAAR
jgi:hypothetical protein